MIHIVRLNKDRMITRWIILGPVFFCDDVRILKQERDIPQPIPYQDFELHNTDDNPLSIYVFWGAGDPNAW